ncbi:hypothetical protein ACP70R_005845 [Stipagrostis hirtigluma subsp. patula]
MAMDAASLRPWPDLPRDLLRLISGRLHDAVDFVRFHAVCQPWRDTPAAAPPFLPWLLVPGSRYRPRISRFRSVFSKAGWCAPGASSRRNSWLASADGVGTWLFTAGAGGKKGDPSRPRLTNPFTGATTTLPPFPDGIQGRITLATNGVVCGDGTVVLYAVGIHDDKYSRCLVTAAVLRPGDAAWTDETAYLQTYDGFEDSCAAAYHHGEVVLVDLLLLYMVKLRVIGGGDDDDVLKLTRTTCQETPQQRSGLQLHPRRLSVHTFESHGELLAACVVLDTGREEDAGDPSALAGALSVWIYALEPEGANGDDDKPRWVARDGRSLGDSVLFLGCPTSFVVDDAGAQFGGTIGGGCAYFVVNSLKTGWKKVPEACRVYRYNFNDDHGATAVDELPIGTRWDDDAIMMWFAPHPPAIAPSQKIRERLRQAPKRKQGAPCPRSIICHGGIESLPHFRMYVGNMPLWVDSSHLEQFFGMHGDVADATVIRDPQTGCSRGFGFVTMVTVSEPAEVFATIDGEIFYGDILRVKKFTEERLKGAFVMPLLAQNKKLDSQTSRCTATRV